MNLDDFSYEQEERRYINPQVGLDEANAFIDNLRTTQGARNAEIAQDTYNLGTAVPSNLGGLSGAGGYFNARYQTPQTNALVGDLRATAQAQALNEAMNNELAKAKQRYDKAYKAAKKRAARTTSVTGGGGTPAGDGGPLEVETETAEQFKMGDEEQTRLGYYTGANGKPMYGTLKVQYQLLDAGKPAQVWAIQNKFPSGQPLKEGAQYQDSTGTYVFTNGQIYKMWRGFPYK